ncbi:aminoglycoside 3-N-acetyltransferase [Lysobacter sp.]|uniref:aminoglycoside 3-N-acetyltransferase n=1 Tax=Lysobacter sp. TaxID=72226 RepID=UPI002D312DF8|nr:aminoglycoside 3-N-acetyltransferase [Lysobacter sp.]HZX75574.1 aminoglycoside 3-N-acetyltransferase [Lysobacter sp.]
MPNDSAAASLAQLTGELRALGLRAGDVVMVHASLKAVGPVEGGGATVAQALLDVVMPAGGILAFGSWDASPYMETLNGARLDDDARAQWPVFDPAHAPTYRGFGLLNEFLRKLPGAERSPHPDASMIGVGSAAPMVRQHPLGCAYGPGSPLERLLQANGRVLLLGAPPDSLTVLHYAEAIAEIPGKRRVSYEMPMPAEDGGVRWVRAEDFDSNGILDCFAAEGCMDAVESIARDYIREQPHLQGRVGHAHCRLFEAASLVDYGRRWLEQRFRDDLPHDEAS